MLAKQISYLIGYINIYFNLISFSLFKILFIMQQKKNYEPYDIQSKPVLNTQAETFIQIQVSFNDINIY